MDKNKFGIEFSNIECLYATHIADKIGGRTIENTPSIIRENVRTLVGLILAAREKEEAVEKSTEK